MKSIWILKPISLSILTVTTTVGYANSNTDNADDTAMQVYQALANTPSVQLGTAITVTKADDADWQTEQYVVVGIKSTPGMKQYDLALAGNSNAAAIVGHVNIGVGNTLHAHAGFNQSGDNKTTAVGARFDHNVTPQTTISFGVDHTRTNDRDFGTQSSSSQATRRYTDGNNTITETTTANTTTHTYFQGEKLTSGSLDATRKFGNNVMLTIGANASDSNIKGNKVGGRVGVGYNNGNTRVGAQYQRLNGENIYSVAAAHRNGNWELGAHAQHNATTKDNAVMGTLTYYFGENNENSRYSSNTSHINNITHSHPASYIPQHKGVIRTNTTTDTQTDITAVPNNPPTIEIPKWPTITALPNHQTYFEADYTGAAPKNEFDITIDLNLGDDWKAEVINYVNDFWNQYHSTARIDKNGDLYIHRNGGGPLDYCWYSLYKYIY